MGVNLSSKNSLWELREKLPLYNFDVDTLNFVPLFKAEKRLSSSLDRSSSSWFVLSDWKTDFITARRVLEFFGYFLWEYSTVIAFMQAIAIRVA